MNGARFAPAILAGCLALSAARAQQPSTPRDKASVTLDGFVTDSALAPLGDATISIVGYSARVVTGRNGRFLFTGLAPGPYVLLARRLGYEPLSVPVHVTDADTERVTLKLERVGTTLDTVVVKAPRVPARLEEFELRYRNREATASFNRDDIIKANPVDTWQMLSRVSAITLIPNGKNGKMLAASTRGMQKDQHTLQMIPCFYSVMIDGVLMGTEGSKMQEIEGKMQVVQIGTFDISMLPRPDEIHGIEVFAGPATIPVKYGGSGDNKMCGLIAVWTR